MILFKCFKILILICLSMALKSQLIALNNIANTNVHKLGKKIANKKTRPKKAVKQAKAKKVLQKINNSNFVSLIKYQILMSPKPIIIYFYSSHCATCNPISNYFDILKKEFSNQYNFIKLNVDDSQIEAFAKSEYGINSIPTFIFLKNNKFIGTGKMSVAYKSLDFLRKQLNAVYKYCDYAVKKKLI